ncbi:SixA phosphatase family protein [Qipengyuania sediminis]|uniref:SixA phosphatase family protein n=1 Tax=Qipengyuania sediminis TaxID=1532023 RepID=UPI001059A55C|nr:histidine phosphatase family protein [Qipengyuania sediminis]
MKTLGLLRHAKSDWGQSDKRDFDRGLNARGKRGAALMGGHIRDGGIAWDRLIASPARRVKLTLESAAIGPAPHFDERLYLASTDTMIEVLRETEGHAVLLAGHNPGLGDLILELVAPSRENALFDEAKVKFPTAAFAVLELAIDDWADLAPECGTLVHFQRPRDLDPELGPED